MRVCLLSTNPGGPPTLMLKPETCSDERLLERLIDKGLAVGFGRNIDDDILHVTVEIKQ